MKHDRLQMPHLFIAALCAALSAPVFADKPEWAGKGKGHDKGEWHGKGKGHDDHDRHRGRERHAYFGDQQRVIVHEYYEDRFRSGWCPPGLAKKRNGCMPPGQAKKWAYGRPLPRDVVYYEVPRELIVRLPPPPPQHRYVRVAADILLIAVGTGMVVDAIQDLGRM